MSVGLDPVLVTETLREEYQRSVETAFPVKDPVLRAATGRLLAEGNALSREPFLEGVQPFRTVGTLRDMVKAGWLRAEVAELLPADRPLFRHQWEAVERFLRGGENLVAASGTGSGKTESFLVPLLHRLVSETREQRARDGVRVILLYPLNALVNDQVKRLLSVLLRQQVGVAPLRFGFYTSRTERTPEAARDALLQELADASFLTELRNAAALPLETDDQEAREEL